MNSSDTCAAAVDVKWSPLGDTFSIAVGNDVCVYYAETMEKLLTLKHEKRVTCIEYLSVSYYSIWSLHNAFVEYALGNRW